MNDSHRSRDRPLLARREQHPIAVFEVRTSECGAKHLHVVTEHGVLKLELPGGPTPDERRTMRTSMM